MGAHLVVVSTSAAWTRYATNELSTEALRARGAWPFSPTSAQTSCCDPGLGQNCISLVAQLICRQNSAGFPRVSSSDAVDGSCTRTEVPSMWVLLRPPPFRGAKHASGHNSRPRYRKVG